MPTASEPTGLPSRESAVGDRPRRRAIQEFLAALRDVHTWQPHRNSYAVFGLLWGLPIPIFSVAIDLWATGRAFSLAVLVEHPIHLVFLVHPLLFMIVFGAMGTVRWHKDTHIRRLIGDLESKIAELAAAYDRLKELDQLKAQFVANVTHELKTPLVAIRGYNEAILDLRFGPLTDKQRDGLAVAMRNIERLQGLIEEVLEFERIDSGELRLDRSEFDFLDLVKETVQNFQPRLESKRLTVELNLPPVARVHADREKIARVLRNLVSNAVKFSFDGGRIGIDARREEADRCLHVTVWDRGKGIPSGLQKHLFTRFWQAARGLADKSEGSGLGLVITKGILEAHQSTIDVVSSEGAGTMVHFRLPLPTAVPAAATVASGASAPL